MKIVLLSIKLCNALDALVRNFLWSNRSDSKPVQLLNWGTVSTPKEDGGLGINPTH